VGSESRRGGSAHYPRIRPHYNAASRDSRRGEYGAVSGDILNDSPVIRPVILCGGSGTRLWPLSRTHYPKQFLRLVDDLSLLQNTLRRLDGLPGLGKTIAVANEHHRFLVAEQFLEIGLHGRHPARTGRPQHGAGGRRGRFADPQRNRRANLCPAAGPSLRPRDHQCGGFSGSGPGGRAARRSRVRWSPLACRPIARKPATATFGAALRCPMATTSTASSRSRMPEPHKTYLDSG
jgi:hypothetical protein